MALITTLLDTVFGGRRNVIAETAQVFRENAENAAIRDARGLNAALAQHASEFRTSRTGFDALIDGLNRLPRPMLAFGTIGLFVTAMTDPIWFAQRMQGLALVPEALWWLMGAIVSFYFGARHQLKGQQFQRDLAVTLAAAPILGPPGDEDDIDQNAALDDWRASQAA